MIVLVNDSDRYLAVNRNHLGEVVISNSNVEDPPVYTILSQREAVELIKVLAVYTGSNVEFS